MRVQIDEAGCNKAVLVAEYLLPGCGRVPRDGFDRRAIDVHVHRLRDKLERAGGDAGEVVDRPGTVVSHV